jgi:hypothetical protein
MCLPCCCNSCDSLYCKIVKTLTSDVVLLFIFADFLNMGWSSSTTGSILINLHSNQSHAIFTIIVKQKCILECTNSNAVISTNFHLVSDAATFA